MISYIIAGLIGILTWQVITLIIFIIIYFIMDDDKKIAETTLICATFIPYFVLEIPFKIIRYVPLLWYRNHLIVCDLCEKIQSPYPDKNGNYSIVTSKQSIFVIKKNMNELIQDETEDYYVKYNHNCKNLDYIPTKNVIYDGKSKDKSFDINLYMVKDKEK